jgi:YcaO-like protein with predicted kinase domain
MGITRVADVTGLDVIGIPVVMVCRPNSRSLSVSQGKALDLVAAKASGVMESVEAYHAERIALPLVLGSANDLRFTHRLVDVARLPQLGNSLLHDGFQLLWIEGSELLGGERVWVPYEMVHTNYTLPAPTGTGCFVGTSSGLAAGNHPLEALSHAICEAVERDATTLWGLLDEDGFSRTRIDPETIDDPGCREALERYGRADVAVGVWETTTDIGIPAFVVLIVERVDDPLRLLYSARGMGCHPNRAIALLRALTEAAQSRLTFIAGARDDLVRSEYELGRSPDLRRRQRLVLDAAGPMRDFADGPSFDGETFDEDVTWELDRLRLAGIDQVVAIDLTRREFGIPVVRVTVPGLEGPTDKVPASRLGARARALVEARR